MASLYTRSDSPYIWLRYYDKNEADPRKRRKSISTKLESNQKGWKAARDLKRRVEAAFVQKELFVKSGIELRRKLLLSEGLAEFLIQKPDIAENTKDAYNLATNHMIFACTNKDIADYFDRDFSDLIKYFHKKGFSQATMGIHTRHLFALWNYFIKKKYVSENVIQKIQAPKGSAEAISKQEMKKILNYFKESNIEHYNLVYFLLLTGFRISSALIQSWESVDLKNNLITATNVKARNKKFYFPIHPELKELLKSMHPQKNGRLFHQYSLGESPVFWKRTIEKLHRRGLIGKKYTLHHIRKTFTSWMVNAGVDQALLVKLLDHSSFRVTDEHYTQMETRLLSSQFKKLRFRR